MAVTAERGKPVCICPFYGKGKKHTKPPTQTKQNPTNYHKAPWEGLLESSGCKRLSPTERNTCFPKNWRCYTLTACSWLNPGHVRGRANSTGAGAPACQAPPALPLPHPSSSEEPVPCPRGKLRIEAAYTQS